MLQVFATSADYGLDPVWEASTEFGLNDPKTDKVGLHCVGEKAQNPSEIEILTSGVGCTPICSIQCICPMGALTSRVTIHPREVLTFLT